VGVAPPGGYAQIATDLIDDRKAVSCNWIRAKKKCTGGMNLGANKLDETALPSTVQGSCCKQQLLPFAAFACCMFSPATFSSCRSALGIS
jgi:hypothetical protein